MSVYKLESPEGKESEKSNIISLSSTITRCSDYLFFAGLFSVVTAVNGWAVFYKLCNSVCCVFTLTQACDCDLGSHEICLEHFLQTKANIGG